MHRNIDVCLGIELKFFISFKIFLKYTLIWDKAIFQ